jgi:hypothetical protein
MTVTDPIPPRSDLETGTPETPTAPEPSETSETAAADTRATADGAAEATAAEKEGSAPSAAAGATAANRPRRAWPVDRRAALRLALGALGVVVLGGTVAASSLLPLPSVKASPLSAAVTPASDGLRLACTGPLLQIIDGEQSGTIATVGTPVHSFGGSAEITPRRLDAPTLQAEGRRAAALESPADPTGEPVRGAAAQSQYGAGGLVGLSAAACPAPSGDQWLVGGSTEVGRTTLINLANPTDVAATVELTLVGEDGAIESPGATGIALAPGEQVVMPLSGFAPSVMSPVVRVQSRGGRVVATLQESIVRGIEAGGVDTIGATAAPATTLAIPGIRIGNIAGLAGQRAGDGYSDLETVVRLYLPGDYTSEVRVGVLADNPRVDGTSFALEAAPGRVVDVPIDGLADGSYTVTIDADLPVVAAVRQSQVGTTGGTDVAWLGAPEVIPGGGEAWLSITPGPDPRLFVYNPGEDPVEVTLTALDGTAVSFTVDPGRTGSMPVTRLTTYRLKTDGDVRAAVSYLGDGTSAAYAVAPPPVQAEPITVYP